MWKSSAIAVLASVFYLVAAPVEVLAEAAFAFGKNAYGRQCWGQASNFRTRAEAVRGALAECQTEGCGPCEIRMQFSKTCFALAVQSRGSGWWAATEPNIRRAERAALDGCVNAGWGQPCRLRFSFCDSINENEERRRLEEAMRQEYLRELRQLEAARDRQRRAQHRIDTARAARQNAEREAALREQQAREAEHWLNFVDDSTGIKPNSKLFITLFGAFLVAWTVGVRWAARNEPMFVRLLAGFVAPFVSTLVLYNLGLESEITLGEWVLLGAPYGLGALVIAISYQVTA